MSTGITKSDDQLKASISTDPFEMSERKEGSNEQVILFRCYQL